MVFFFEQRQGKKEEVREKWKKIFETGEEIFVYAKEEGKGEKKRGENMEAQANRWSSFGVSFRAGPRVCKR